MEGYYRQVCSIFKVESFSAHQKKAFHTVIKEKNNVVVNLPTARLESLLCAGDFSPAQF